MMKQHIKELKKSVVFYILISMFLVVATTLILLLVDKHKNQQKIEKFYLKQIERSIKHEFKHFLQDYTYRVNNLFETTNIVKLLKNKNRDALFKLLKPKFDLIKKENPDILIMQVHLKDGTSFLRVHKPNIYGDKIANKRAMLREIHKKHKTITGYETGIFATAYRVVIPIFDKQKNYIGAFELGIDPNFIVDSIRNINGFNGAVFINKNKLKLCSKPSDIVIDGYKLQSVLDKNLQAICKKLKELKNNTIVQTDNKKYLVYLLTLKDFKQKDSVKIVFFQDITNISGFLETSVYELYIFIFLIFLIMATLIYRRITLFQNEISIVYERLRYKLVEKDYMLVESQRISHMGSWKLDIRTNKLTWSDETFNIFEIDKNSFEATLEAFLNTVHPKDREKVKNAYENSLKTKEPYRITHRLLMDDGRIKYINERCETSFDKDGNPLVSIGTVQDITEQKILENKVILLKQQFEQFMEFMPANIIIKENDLITYANSAAMSSLNKHNIIGKKMEYLFSQEIVDKLKQYEKHALKYGLNEEILEFVDYNNEKKIYRNMTFILGRNDKKRLGIVNIDITKEYKANREIERVLSAFERSNISVVMTDILGNIEYVNPSWCRTTGYSRDELIGQNPNIVKSGFISHETYKRMWKQLTDGKVWNSELKNKAKDGSEFWEDSTIIPSFDKHGKVNGYIAFKLEINEKIKLKQELRDKEEIMIAQSRHAAMGEMISMIAHQWRQPISVISMDANNILVDIELDLLDKNELKTTAKDIIIQTQELSKTIDDFREFFKPNKNAEKVYLKDILDDTLSVIGKSLENNNIKVIIDIDESIEIETFSRELMQVMINIIKNAKEVLIEKDRADKYIKINFYKKNNYIKLKFTDNGGGINDELIDKIFIPYFTTKGEKNGTGLGLYISKTIIEKHLKGTIKAYNIENGACFLIELPSELNFSDGNSND